jgi:5-methylthioadenosine/S-adenosylhomocysteine deaminase
LKLVVVFFCEPCLSKFVSLISFAQFCFSRALDLDVNVGLETDGPASNNSLDMFDTMKCATLLQKLAYHDSKVLPAYDVLKMATFDGAKALGLENTIGSLGARGSDVDAVMVDGKTLMENRRVATFDEQAVMEEAGETALNLLSR